jgi:hypothetical protein
VRHIANEGRHHAVQHTRPSLTACGGEYAKHWPTKNEVSGGQGTLKFLRIRDFDPPPGRERKKGECPCSHYTLQYVSSPCWLAPWS